MLVVSSWSSIQLRTGTEAPPSVTFAPHAPWLLDVLCGVVLKSDFPVRRPIENATADDVRTARVAYRRYIFLVEGWVPDDARSIEGAISSLCILSATGTLHQIYMPQLDWKPTEIRPVLIVLGNFLCISLSRKDNVHISFRFQHSKTCSKFSWLVASIHWLLQFTVTHDITCEAFHVRANITTELVSYSIRTERQS